MEPELSKLLEEHKRYFTVLADGKVKCKVNDHQFPPRLDVISAFIRYVLCSKLRLAEPPLQTSHPRDGATCNHLRMHAHSFHKS